MSEYSIAGLDVGNDEELQRVFQKIYSMGKQINILEVNEKQLEFIGDCYDVYGRSEDHNGKLVPALYFDPGYNEIELRIEGENTDA